MSLAQRPIDVVPIRAAALDVDSPVHYGAYLGGSQISYRETVSTSYSSTSASFTCNPPSPDVVVDREVILKVPVKITFAGTSAAGARLLQSGYDAFRAFPLHSNIDNIQLQLNNSKTSIDSSELVHEIMKLHHDDNMLDAFSMTPCFPDQSQEYSDLVNTNRNALAQFGEKTGTPFRGGFVIDAITNAVDGTSAVVEATLAEPLMISPLLWGGVEGKGMLHLQNMSVNVKWNSDLSRMWSHAAGSGSTITGVTVEFPSAPSVMFKYITPPPTMQLPKSIDFDYQTMDVNTTELGAAQASGASYTMISSNLQLNVVPSHLMIYAKERRGDRLYTGTDSWQSLEALDISFANQNGIFSGADKRELYNTARRNGLKQSYTEWSGDATYFESGGSSTEIHGTAGVFIAKFGRDIPIQDPSVAPGVPGQFNMQVRCTLKNQNQSRSISPALYVVPIYNGVLTLTENQTVVQTAVLSQQDVLDASAKAESHGAIDASFVEGGVLIGGNFLGDLSRGLSKALPVVRKVRKAGQKILSVPGVSANPYAMGAKAGLDVAEAIGLGQKRGKGVLVGGKKMSRAELRKALAQ